VPPCPALTLLFFPSMNPLEKQLLETCPVSPIWIVIHTYFHICSLLNISVVSEF
jgi:hypothetical protein